MGSSFWQNKRVLLTGHTGFKGSWMALWLQKLGAHVTGLALEPPTEPSLFELAHVAEGMDSRIGDIRDADLVKRVVSECDPEIVFHMAAQALVLPSYEDPIGTYATNVMGTVHVMDACRQCQSLKSLVVITTDKCYENREWDWGYRENDPMGGFDPYSNSKGCAELSVSAYRQSFFGSRNQSGVNLASVRAGNVIGGGDWGHNRLIPDFMKAMLKQETVVIRSPGAIRPWQHVMEPLAGYLRLAEKLFNDESYAGGWNFGPWDSDAKQVQWIVERISALWGDDAKWRLDDVQHPHEATYLKLDCSKARNRLGWEPRLDLAMALEWIVEWYRQYQKQADVRALTEQQIDRYQNIKQPNEQ